MITVAKIAQQLGVSKATVSRALRNRPEVKAETKLRIIEAAKMMGYEPDAVLSALSQRRWAKSQRASKFLSALVFPQGKPQNPNGYYAQKVAALTKRGRELGIDFIAFEAKEKEQAPQWERQWKRMGIESVLCFPIRDDVWVQIDWDRYYHVLYVGHLQNRQLNVIRFDWSHAVDLAVGKALESGYMRIGFVSNTVLNSFEERSLLGCFYVCRHELLRHGPQPSVLRYSWHLGGAHCRDGTLARNALRDWLAQERPDCIIGPDVLTYHLLRVNGVSIPEQVAYIALRRGDSRSESGIAAVDHGTGELGKLGVELLHHLLATGQRGILPFPIIRTVEGQWHDGASLPQRGHASS